MKQFLLLCFAISALVTSSMAMGAAVKAPLTANQDVAVNGVQDFIQMSTADFEKLSGKKLGVLDKMKMKIAQKQLKKSLKKQENQTASANGDISKGLYIVLAIFGLAWIAMGVMDDWQGSNWIINLLLSLLFVLPGFIHALIVMNKYYK